MYHALLTNRYLTTRVIPLVAVGAVGLCVALVIIVVSVMTGFLNMVRDSGRTLMGDVVVSYPVAGIPHYEMLIEYINEMPEASDATPVVNTWGLLRMPYPVGQSKQTETVQVWGIEPESFAAVTGYGETLHWRQINEELRRVLLRDVINDYARDIHELMSQSQRRELVAAFSTNPDVTDEQIAGAIATLDAQDQWSDLISDFAYRSNVLRDILDEDQWKQVLSFDARLTDDAQILRDGLTLTPSRKGADRPGIVLGMHVSLANTRQDDGTYQPGLDWQWWMPRYQLTLTVLPVLSGGFIEPETRQFQVVNEFQSGVFLIDDTRVLIPLRDAQEIMQLDEAQRVDPDDPTEVIGTDPARATMVLVRTADGVTPEQLRDAVKVAYRRFAGGLLSDDDVAVFPPPLRDSDVGGGATVQTWLEQQASFIGPIEKERELMRTLFSIVYLVCAGLVLAIFWAIVYEKTRDIGILRSIGASRLGISWIFLRYGLVVGILGAFLGLGLGYLVVHNINSIHDALAKPPVWLAVTTFALACVVLVITVIRSIRGRLMPLVLGSLLVVAFVCVGGLMLYIRFVLGGFIMWDPSVYYFETIPNEVDYNTAITTMIGAVVFSLIGAFLPAAKAADVDPVNALRYE